MKNNVRKSCFACAACAFYCPNANCDLFEDLYDLPCSEAGLERISCRDCQYNSGLCCDCLFVGSIDCLETIRRLRQDPR